MYEQPTIALVGKVSDVVMGIAYRGVDIDGAFVPDCEFLDDPAAQDGSAG